MSYGAYFGILRVKKANSLTKDNFMLLKKAINSVKNQSFRNYELILIYDNPENRKNLKLIKEFIKKKKIKILINNKNLGAGLSRK